MSCSGEQGCEDFLERLIGVHILEERPEGEQSAALNQQTRIGPPFQKFIVRIGNDYQVRAVLETSRTRGTIR